MKRTAIYMRCIILGVAAIIIAGIVVFVVGAQEEEDIPALFNVNTFRAEIVDTMFCKEVIGENGTYKVGDDDKYRAIIVTLCITKPVKTPITIYASDLSLHYRYGDSFDVAPCYGLSNFSRDLEVDRSIRFSEKCRAKKSTGTATLRSDKFYVDAVFAGMEPDTRELWYPSRRV